MADKWLGGKTSGGWFVVYNLLQWSGCSLANCDHQPGQRVRSCHKDPQVDQVAGQELGVCLGDRVHHCHLHSLGTKNCCSSITYYSKLAKLYLGLQQVVEYPPSTVSWFVGPLHSLHLQASQPSEHVQVQWWESEGSSWYLSNSPAPPSPWHLVA